MSDPLTTLLGNTTRIRLLRLFVFNPDSAYSMTEILRRAKLVRRTGRAELSQLERAGIVVKKMILEQIPKTTRRRRVVGYTLNPKSPIINPLRTFLLDTAPIEGKTLERHLRTAGKIEILVMAGVFVREFEHRIDVLVGFQKLNTAKVEIAIKNLEAELGVEIRYAAFETQDLLYRISLRDKLARDVLDYPHEIVIDKVGIRNEVHR